MPLTKTVPLTVALPDVAVKFAVFDVPFVESHGVPDTPVQLVAEVSHVPLVALHVPSAPRAFFVKIEDNKKTPSNKTRAAFVAPNLRLSRD